MQLRKLEVYELNLKNPKFEKFFNSVSDNGICNVEKMYNAMKKSFKELAPQMIKILIKAVRAKVKEDFNFRNYTEVVR